MPEVARTDDILTIIQVQFEALPQGLKLIAGDLNGTPEAFNTIGALTTENGLADVGMVSNLCDGAPGQNTCHSKDTSTEARIDYFPANEWLFLAITTCRVDHGGDYPTHRPLIIEINVDKMGKDTRELQTTTIDAKLREGNILDRVQAATAEADAEAEAQGEKVQ